MEGVEEKASEGGGGILLEYQTAEKVHKRAAGGLMLMAGTVGLLCLLMAGPFVGSMMSGGRAWGVVMLEAVFGMVPFLWGTSYVTMAVLFRNRVRWAGWVAMGMTGVMLVGWMVLASVGVLSMVTDGEWDHSWVPWVLVSALLAVGVGLGAVMVEIWRAQRLGRVWGR